MANKDYINNLRLLPHYLRLIGFLVAGLMFVGLIFMRVMEFEFFTSYADMIKNLSIFIIILGLGVSAFTKDKIEDEMVGTIRMQAFGFAFIFSIVNVLFDSASMAFTGAHWGVEMNVQGLIITMLITFHLVYLFKKNFS